MIDFECLKIGDLFSVELTYNGVTLHTARMRNSPPITLKGFCKTSSNFFQHGSYLTFMHDHVTADVACVVMTSNQAIWTYGPFIIVGHKEEPILDYRNTQKVAIVMARNASTYMLSRDIAFGKPGAVEQCTTKLIKH